jgi:Leucine-rich repeat (LRR) protein
VVNGNIVSIDLSYNNLSAHQLAKRSTATANPMILDSGIITFRYLRALNLAGNNIDTVPQWFAGCCHLKALDLSNNRLSTLPGFMTSFRQLESLNLSGNQIANLPVQTAQWADAYAPDWKNTQSTTSTAGSQRGQTIEKILRRSFFDGGKLQVTFSQPVYAEVVLYALSGRKIVVIAKQHFESGLHSFNIKNVQLPCGTYMVTIKAGNSMLETLRFVAH